MSRLRQGLSCRPRYAGEFEAIFTVDYSKIGSLHWICVGSKYTTSHKDEANSRKWDAEMMTPFGSASSISTGSVEPKAAYLATFLADRTYAVWNIGWGSDQAD